MRKETEPFPMRHVRLAEQGQRLIEPIHDDRREAETDLVEYHQARPRHQGAREVGCIVDVLIDLMARAGGAGARAAGDPADDGVETEGDAMSLKRWIEADPALHDYRQWKPMNGSNMESN